MGNNIKGITIEIGGNTGPLTTALKGVNKTAGDLQGELREVNKQLKFDPKNTELLKQKEDLLKQSTQALEEKQKTLKTAVEQAHTAFEKGDMAQNQTAIVNLLKSYSSDYNAAGSDLGDALLTGFKPKVDAISALVQGVAQQIEAARQTADSAMAAAASAAAASASVTASKTAASSSGTSGGKSVSVTNNVTVAQKTTAAQALAVVKAVTAQVLFGV